MNHDKLEGLAQALFEESGDALFLFDPDTDQLLDVNSTAQRLTGFLLWELLRMPVTNLFLYGGTSDLTRLRQAAQKTGTFHSQEGYYLLTMQEGVWIPVNLTISRLHVKPKTLALITARDVREQREAHNRLKEMEAEYRRVLESCSDCFWNAEIDAAGQCEFRYFSAMVEKMTGHTAEFYLGAFNRWWGSIHPQDQPRWEKAFVRQRGGHSTKEEYRIVRTDGTIYWVRDTVAVVRSPDGKTLKLDGKITDITVPKLAETALKDYRLRFDAFMDNGPAIAFVKDQAGRYLYVNAGFQRLFGRETKDLLGKTDLDLLPAATAKKVRDNDAAVFASEQPLQAIETITFQNGATRNWSVYKFPIDDGSGGQHLGGLAFEIAAVTKA